jgi:hypothetical protein
LDRFGSFFLGNGQLETMNPQTNPRTLSVSLRRCVVEDVVYLSSQAILAWSLGLPAIFQAIASL